MQGGPTRAGFVARRDVRRACAGRVGTDHVSVARTETSLPASVVDDGEEACTRTSPSGPRTRSTSRPWSRRTREAAGVRSAAAASTPSGYRDGSGPAATGALGSAVMAPPPPRRDPAAARTPGGESPVGDAAVPAAVAAAVPAAVPAGRRPNRRGVAAQNKRRRAVRSRRRFPRGFRSSRGGPEEDGVGPRRVTGRRGGRAFDVGTRATRVGRAGSRWGGAREVPRNRA